VRTKRSGGTLSTKRYLRPQRYLRLLRLARLAASRQRTKPAKKRQHGKIREVEAQ
jgi:hypothetical protein